MTDEFLQFSKRRGNDLTTPMPMHRFPGLTDGDRWCLCATRWKEAYDAGKAPKVVLEATHMATLEYASLEELRLGNTRRIDAGGQRDELAEA